MPNEATPVTDAPAAESAVEVAKRNGRHLRGTLCETLASDATLFCSEEMTLLKFHGSNYQIYRVHIHVQSG